VNVYQLHLEFKSTELENPKVFEIAMGSFQKKGRREEGEPTISRITDKSVRDVVSGIEGKKRNAQNSRKTQGL